MAIWKSEQSVNWLCKSTRQWCWVWKVCELSMDCSLWGWRPCLEKCGRVFLLVLCCANDRSEQVTVALEEIKWNDLQTCRPGSGKLFGTWYRKLPNRVFIIGWQKKIPCLAHLALVRKASLTWRTVAGTEISKVRPRSMWQAWFSSGCAGANQEFHSESFSESYPL